MKTFFCRAVWRYPGVAQLHPSAKLQSREPLHVGFSHSGRQLQRQSCINTDGKSCVGKETENTRDQKPFVSVLCVSCTFCAKQS